MSTSHNAVKIIKSKVAIDKEPVSKPKVVKPKKELTEEPVSKPKVVKPKKALEVIKPKENPCATGEFSYDDVFHGKSLAEWANLAHKELSIKSGWKYFPLQPGQFGFDNMVVSIGYAFSKTNSKMTTAQSKMADLIHDGWISNYTYWRDEKPWLTNSLYKKPAKALGDDRRNECATTAYSDLPNEEKEKDDIIADFLIKIIN